MAREKKPKAYEWRERKFPDDWNTTTFRAYLSEKHKERLGIPYVTQNVKVDCGMIKNMMNEYGAEVVREFIDRALEQYKPSRKYPGISFPRMVQFYKSRLIPRILAEQADKKKSEQAAEVEIVEMSDILDLL